jgi:ferredoxin
MARKPFVDQDQCISCGLCASVVPEVFRLNGNNVSEPYAPFGAPEEKIQQAIDGCPVSCISWVE